MVMVDVKDVKLMMRMIFLYLQPLSKVLIKDAVIPSIICSSDKLHICTSIDR